MSFEAENTGEIQQNQEVEVGQEIQGTEQATPQTEEKNWKEEFDKRDKSYKELQSLYGRSTQELGALRKFKQEYEPYLSYLQQQEKQQRYQADPSLEMKEWVQQQLQPVYEQRVDMEATTTVNTLQSELGEQYETLAPIMANVLKYYQSEQPEVAEYLAKNPIALVRQAAGDLYLHNYISQKNQVAQTKQMKQTAAKQMAGTARSNVAGNRQSNDMGSMDMNQMREHLRKLGAAISGE